MRKSVRACRTGMLAVLLATSPAHLMAQQAPPAATAAPAGVVLRFRNAPIADVVAAVAGALQRSYEVDPNVTGRITLDYPNPVAPDAVLSLLDQALRAQGARAVETGSVIRVLPAGAVPPGVGLRPRAPVAPTTDVVTLRHVDPSALATVLRSVLPPGVTVAADTRRRALILSGPARDRRNAIELIRVFDVEWLARQNFALAKLDAAAPADVVRELEAIFGGPVAEGKTPALRFVPVERINGVLIIGANQATIARAIRAAQTLDAGDSLAGRQLFIYPVSHGRASDIARVLGGLFTTGTGPGALTEEEESAAALRPGLTDQSIDRGLGNEEAGGLQTGNAIDQTTGTDDETQRRTSIAGRPARVSATGRPVQFGTERVRIVADERNNAVAVLASPADWRIIQNFLQRLDVRPFQVYIQATIAEVTLTDELRYGLQWFFQSGNFDFTLSDLENGGVQPRFPGFAGVFESADARIVLDAIDNVTDLRVVSSPQLVVLNNQTATLQVGNDVPVATRSAVSTLDPEAPIVNNIEFRPTGVILRVTPRANAGGSVMIDIEQEVSDVVETRSSTIDSPTIQQRRIESTVTVQSGETIALGGLIQDRTTKGSRGIPVLSQIPVLGALFGTKTDNANRTELLVLLTPRLLSSNEDMRSLTDELRARMTAVAPLEARIN